MASQIILNILLVTVMLAYTSYLDLKKREVDDYVWIIFGLLGATLLPIEYLLHWYNENIFVTLFSIGISSAIGLGLFYFGFYGGADGKALIVVSVFLPVYTSCDCIQPITSIIVLTNAVILSLILPISISVYNLSQILKGENIFRGLESESKKRKLLAIFLGFRIKPNSKRKFMLPMEKTVNDRRTFSFSLLEDDFESRQDVWVTPGIPLLVFMTVGFLVLILFGDLLTVLIKLIFHL
jgi:preflagellin peptidase FlaK